MGCSLVFRVGRRSRRDHDAAKPGAPALNTLMHRISVLSMAHHLAKQPNPRVPRMVLPVQWRAVALRKLPSDSALQGTAQ